MSIVDSMIAGSALHIRQIVDRGRDLRVAAVGTSGTTLHYFSTY